MGNCSSNSEDESQETSRGGIKLSEPDRNHESSAQSDSKHTSPYSKKILNPDSCDNETQGVHKNCHKSSHCDIEDPERPEKEAGGLASGPTKCLNSGTKERVLVHPICVGQGDAILLEIQHENGKYIRCETSRYAISKTPNYVTKYCS